MSSSTTVVLEVTKGLGYAQAVFEIEGSKATSKDVILYIIYVSRPISYSA